MADRRKEVSEYLTGPDSFLCEVDREALRRHIQFAEAHKDDEARIAEYLRCEREQADTASDVALLRRAREIPARPEDAELRRIMKEYRDRG